MLVPSVAQDAWETELGLDTLRAEFKEDDFFIHKDMKITEMIHFTNLSSAQIWWRMSLRQIDPCEFDTSLVYTSSPTPTRATQ